MYYLIVNGTKTGPYTEQGVGQMIQQGAIGRETQFWRGGMNTWESIGSSPIFYGPAPRANVYQSSPPQTPPINLYHSAPIVVQPVFIAQRKSRVAFVLLGLFLGGFGIHNFYAGYSGKGVAQLLLMLFLFWTIVVPIGIGIWVLIEVITVNHDSYGNRMI